MREIFQTTVGLDFEYEITPGGLPRVLCLIAHVLDERLQLVRTVRYWRGDFGAKPPFDIGPDALIVAYSAWAEIVEPGLGLEGVTKSEIQKCATETGSRSAPKTAVCCSSPTRDRREALP